MRGRALSTEETAGGNPLAEGLVYARAVAEIATLIMVGLTASTRLREQRLQVHRGSDVDANRVRIESSHADARLAWAPGLEPDFASATGRQAAAVWVAAEPWAVHDPEADEAMRSAEERLTALYPEPMANYKQRLAAGADRFDAMSAVAAQLRQRARPADSVHTYHDIPPTGWHRRPGAEYEEASGSAERAAALAAQAFPQTIPGCLA